METITSNNGFTYSYNRLVRFGPSSENKSSSISNNKNNNNNNNNNSQSKSQWLPRRPRLIDKWSTMETAQRDVRKNQMAICCKLDKASLDNPSDAFYQILAPPLHSLIRRSHSKYNQINNINNYNTNNNFNIININDNTSIAIGKNNHQPSIKTNQQQQQNQSKFNENSYDSINQNNKFNNNAFINCNNDKFLQVYQLTCKKIETFQQIHNTNTSRIQLNNQIQCKSIHLHIKDRNKPNNRFVFVFKLILLVNLLRLLLVSNSNKSAYLKESNFFLLGMAESSIGQLNPNSELKFNLNLRPPDSSAPNWFPVGQDGTFINKSAFNDNIDWLLNEDYVIEKTTDNKLEENEEAQTNHLAREITTNKPTATTIKQESEQNDHAALGSQQNHNFNQHHHNHHQLQDYQHHHHRRHQHHHHNHLHGSQQNNHHNQQQNHLDTSKHPPDAAKVKPSSLQNHRARRNHNNGGYFDTSSAADRPLVATRKGPVRGVTQKIFTGKSVDAFLGIPYAQAPIGRYRFRHPLPINPWTTELDASRMSNSCYQTNDTHFGANFRGTSVWNANTLLSEDCLYLNIWTPFGVANTTLSPSSAQMYHHRMSEQSKVSSIKRPVLVWIFGGGFYSGTSSLTLYEGGTLASEEDIIVVSINYRVSALGFLYFGRPEAPGNAGLFDQLMALQWINDNIDQFGGDPNRVTIFGESAGAVSVAFHLLSPLSRNLFNQAILQSGAATCPWGVMDSQNLIANGLQLASLLNCPSNNSDFNSVIECLLKSDPNDLVSQDVGPLSTILNFPFVPVVDGSFLLESPKESLQKSNFKPARILLGSNNDEGNSFLVYNPEYSNCPSTSSSPNENPSTTTTTISTTTPSIYHQNTQTLSPVNELNRLQTIEMSDSNVNLSPMMAGDGSSDFMETNEMNSIKRQYSMPIQQQQAHPTSQSSQTDTQFDINDPKPCKPHENLSLTHEDFIRVLRDDQELSHYVEHLIGKEAIIFEYSNWNNPSEPVSNYDALDKIVGDYYFTCHVNEFANRYANAGNAVYMYYFRQRSSISSWPKWMGVLHGDEIYFVFGEPLNPSFNYTTKEVELSRRMMKYWANFAKFGNPTKSGENTSIPEKWPEYADKKQYFELNADYVRVGRGPRSKQCAFWSHYLPKLLKSFGLFVILVLTIAFLLFYAKRIGKLELSSSQNSD